MLQRNRVTVACLGALACCAAAHAGRTLEHEAVIPAPVSDVWAAFTTAEGFMSWAVPNAEVDFRVGGEMRTSYNPQGDLRDEHTIVNRILAFEPERMLAMKNVQAPEGFANAHLFQETWSVIYFEPAGHDATRIRMVGMGYGEGPEWDDVYNKFKIGNAHTLEQLKRKFAPEPGASESAEHHPLTALDIASRFVGGEWIHDGASPDGSAFRVRNLVTRGADGKSLITQSWLGDENGMFDHGETIIYRQPGTRRTMFFNINEHGAVSKGELRAVGEDTIEWDWNLTSMKGETRTFLLRTTFLDNDRYEFTLMREVDDGGWEQQVQVEFERVDEAPPVFHELIELPVEHD